MAEIRENLEQVWLPLNINWSVSGGLNTIIFFLQSILAWYFDNQSILRMISYSSMSSTIKSTNNSLSSIIIGQALKILSEYITCLSLFSYPWLVTILISKKKKNLEFLISIIANNNHLQNMQCTYKAITSIKMHNKHLLRSDSFFLSGRVYMNGLQNLFKTLALIPTIISSIPPTYVSIIRWLLSKIRRCYLRKIQKI